MKGITVYFENGNFYGNLTMRSTSHFKAVRVNKEDIDRYKKKLDGNGIYLLLKDENQVYVDKTDNDTVYQRIFKPHSKNIGKKWHAVLAFICDKTLKSEELEYIQNAICELLWDRYYDVLTKTLEICQCSAIYRKEHYALSPSQTDNCDGYIEDIRKYLDWFPKSIIPIQEFQTKSEKNNKSTDNVNVTYLFKSPKGD